jgi:hypothetical protein
MRKSEKKNIIFFASKRKFSLPLRVEEEINLVHLVTLPSTCLKIVIISLLSVCMGSGGSFSSNIEHSSVTRVPLPSLRLTKKNFYKNEDPYPHYFWKLELHPDPY